jgi:hypothetical protein
VLRASIGASSWGRGDRREVRPAAPWGPRARTTRGGRKGVDLCCFQRPFVTSAGCEEGRVMRPLETPFPVLSVVDLWVGIG